MILGWLDRVHPDDVARLEDALLACQSGRSSGLRLEYRILHHHGHYIRLEERIRRDERGYLLGVVRHLDPAAVLVEERHGTDPLTGLESRGRFEQLLEERLATESGTFSLLQFSVDHMAKIQQLFGEAACDAMLAKLARIVRHELRREDPFARWDEDGFILMLSQTEPDECAGDRRAAAPRDCRCQPAVTAAGHRQYRTGTESGWRAARSSAGPAGQLSQSGQTGAQHRHRLSVVRVGCACHAGRPRARPASAGRRWSVGSGRYPCPRAAD